MLAYGCLVSLLPLKWIDLRGCIVLAVVLVRSDRFLVGPFVVVYFFLC
jgi:hypothetical protein